jgi:hypothetical protein
MHPRFRVRKFDRTGTLGAIKPKLQRVGVLASPAVRLVGLYKSRMEESSFEALFPNLKDEAALLEVIRAVKAGRLDKKRRQKYAEIAGTLINAGAEAFLIACTELSVIGPPGQYNGAGNRHIGRAGRGDYQECPEFFEYDFTSRTLRWRPAPM